MARPRYLAIHTNDFVSLSRSMDFTVALLQNLARDPEQSMEEAVEESYNLTLKPWHGWISKAALKVIIPPSLLAYIRSYYLHHFFFI